MKQINTKHTISQTLLAHRILIGLQNGVEAFHLYTGLFLTINDTSMEDI
jgi:hypothetical protein